MITDESAHHAKRLDNDLVYEFQAVCSVQMTIKYKYKIQTQAR